MKKTSLGVCAAAALAAAIATIPAAEADAERRVLPASRIYPVQYGVRHQFRQVMLPTDVPNQFRPALWIMNPLSGKIRLCVLDGADKAMTCSAWTGQESQGKYRILPIYIRRNRPGMNKAGLWIVDYGTGAVRACTIGDLANPTTTLKCSSAQ